MYPILMLGNVCPSLMSGQAAYSHLKSHAGLNELRSPAWKITLPVPFGSPPTGSTRGVPRVTFSSHMERYRFGATSNQGKVEQGGTQIVLIFVGSVAPEAIFGTLGSSFLSRCTVPFRPEVCCTTCVSSCASR